MHLSESRRLLAESGIPRAQSLARAEEVRFPALGDELHSGAMLALVRAAGSYDATRGTTFPSWMTTRVCYEFRDVKRREVPKGYRSDPSQAPKMYSMSQSPERIDSGTVLMTSATPDVPEALEREDLVQWLLTEVPEEHEDLCRRVFMEGQTREGAAGDLGLSPESVSRMLGEAAARMREALTALECA